MEEWKVIITKSGQKDLENLDQSIQKRIIQKVNWLLENFQEINQEQLSAMLGKAQTREELHKLHW